MTEEIQSLFEVNKNKLFTNTTIIDTSTIKLTPISYEFSVAGANFHYSKSKNRFRAIVDNDFLPGLIEFLNNQNFDYFKQKRDNKKIFRHDSDVIIKSPDPIKFLLLLKEQILLADYPDFKIDVIYNSIDYLANTNYTYDFFKNNIKTIVHDNIYTTINIYHKREDPNDEYIHISLSGNSIIIDGSIKERNSLTSQIEDITACESWHKMRDTKYFYLSNNYDIPLDYDKINTLFNDTLLYFPDLKIEYVYIGFNYYYP